MRLKQTDKNTSVRICLFALCLLMITGLLQGCVGGAIVAGAAVSGAAIGGDKRQTEVIIDDKGIELSASRAIARTPGLNDETNISITSFNHIVLMTGQATNTRARDRAIDVVRHTNQVRKVHNAVSIGAASSIQSRLVDSGITAKVKLALLSTKGFSAANIKVVTEDKIVYLMGMVDRNTAKSIKDAVGQVSGIDKVIDVFEITTEK